LVDTRFQRWIVHHRTPWLDDFFVALSQVGVQGAIFLVIAAISALYWRRPAIFLYVLLGSLLADVLSYALRYAIGRERPPLSYPDPPPLVRLPGTPAFPSGHAATAFACASLLGWLTPLPKVPLFVLAALIAFSRVYVGVHYPLDAIGGAVVGLATATALRRLVEARRRSTPAPQ
jgi:undecaprenyl-diphosphatase